MPLEYVALSWRTANAANDEEFEREKARLMSEGWSVDRCAPWSQEAMPKRLTGGACIMRRPKDEPRMWTTGEIEEVAEGIYKRLDTEKSGCSANVCGGPRLNPPRVDTNVEPPPR